MGAVLAFPTHQPQLILVQLMHRHMNQAPCHAPGPLQVVCMLATMHATLHCAMSSVGCPCSTTCHRWWGNSLALALAATPLLPAPALPRTPGTALRPPQLQMSQSAHHHYLHRLCMGMQSLQPCMGMRMHLSRMQHHPWTLHGCGCCTDLCPARTCMKHRWVRACQHVWCMHVRWQMASSMPILSAFLMRHLHVMPNGVLEALVHGDMFALLSKAYLEEGASIGSKS